MRNKHSQLISIDSIDLWFAPYNPMSDCRFEQATAIKSFVGTLGPPGL